VRGQINRCSRHERNDNEDVLDDSRGLTGFIFRRVSRTVTALDTLERERKTICPSHLFRVNIAGMDGSRNTSHQGAPVSPRFPICVTPLPALNDHFGTYRPHEQTPTISDGHQLDMRRAGWHYALSDILVPLNLCLSSPSHTLASSSFPGDDPPRFSLGTLTFHANSHGAITKLLTSPLLILLPAFLCA
jgi:hypothetical protein